MAYNSKYTGEQVEQAVDNALRMYSGTVTVPAQSDGHAQLDVENAAPNNGNMRSFANVHRIDYGSGGVIIPIISYTTTPSGDVMRIHLYGDGVKKGVSYEVDYLLIRGE